MKPFRFPLQPLRVIREQKERAAQQRYAGALRACEEAAARVRNTSEELNTCWATLNRELSSGVTGTQLLRTRAWCNVLELRLRERTGDLEKTRLEMDSVWQEVIRATRDRETLDRFHDKCRSAYDREMQRVEQNTLDELATQLSAVRTPMRMGAEARV
jgi:flagellar export protein FliJ